MLTTQAIRVEALKGISVVHNINNTKIHPTAHLNGLRKCSQAHSQMELRRHGDAMRYNI